MARQAQLLPPSPAEQARALLLRVSLRWATFGLVLVDGRVTEAPPLARWCIGKEEWYVRWYWRSRGADVQCISDPGTQSDAR